MFVLIPKFIIRRLFLWRWDKAISLMASGDDEAALQLLQILAPPGPYVSVCTALLANCHNRLGRAAEADSLYTLAIQQEIAKVPARDAADKNYIVGYCQFLKLTLAIEEGEIVDKKKVTEAFRKMDNPSVSSVLRKRFLPGPTRSRLSKILAVGDGFEGTN